MCLAELFELFEFSIHVLPADHPGIHVCNFQDDSRSFSDHLFRRVRVRLLSPTSVFACQGFSA